MNNVDFRRECEYQSVMAVARTMFRRGLITDDELSVIDTIFLEKTGSLLGRLCSEIPHKNVDMFGDLS
jgi:hypothetical protein